MRPGSRKKQREPSRHQPIFGAVARSLEEDSWPRAFSTSQEQVAFTVISPKQGAELALSELEGCVYRYPSGATGLADLLSPCTKKEDEEDTLLLSNLQFNDYVTSPQCDADTEGARTGSLNCSGHFNLGEEDSSKPITQLKYFGVVGKPSISDASPVSDNARSERPSEESIPLQPSLAFRKEELDCSEEAFTLTFSNEEMMLQSKEALRRQSVLQIHEKQLDEMADLCFQKESLIHKMSELDFGDFVMKLDEILILKSKCIQRMRTQLQPFLPASSKEAPLLPTSPS